MKNNKLIRKVLPVTLAVLIAFQSGLSGVGSIRVVHAEEITENVDTDVSTEGEATEEVTEAYTEASTMETSEEAISDVDIQKASTEVQPEDDTEEALSDNEEAGEDAFNFIVDDSMLALTAVSSSISGTLMGWNPNGRGYKTVYANGSTHQSPEFLDFTGTDGYWCAPYCLQVGAAVVAGDVGSGVDFESYGSLTTEQKLNIRHAVGFMSYVSDTSVASATVYWTNQCLIWYYAGQMSDSDAQQTLTSGFLNGTNAYSEYSRIRGLMDEYYTAPTFGVRATSASEITASVTYKLTYDAASGTYYTILHDTSGMLSKGRMNSVTSSNSNLTFTQCNADGSANSSGEYIKVTSSSYISQSSPATCTQTKNTIYTPSSANNVALLNGTSGHQNCMILGDKTSDPVAIYFAVYTEGTATLQIQKANDSGISSPYDFSGAVFYIYTTTAVSYNGTDYVAGAKIAEVTTNANGFGSVSGLPLGIYKAKEITAPTGWIKSNEEFTLNATSITSGNVALVTATVSEKPETTGIELYKKDKQKNAAVTESEAQLTGAVYGIYATSAIMYNNKNYTNGDLVATITTANTDSKVAYAKIEGLPLATYKVKEITASTGYELDPTEYTANGIVDGVSKIDVTITSKESPILTNYHINKVTISNGMGTTTASALKGCSFSMYSLPDAVAQGLRKNSDGSYDLNNFDYTKLTAYRSGITDEDGLLTFTDIYYGSYIVVETDVPRDADGEALYRKVEPYIVTLPSKNSSGSYKPDVYAYLVDDDVCAMFKLEKYDSFSGDIITGSATYKLYNLKTKQYESLTVYTTSGLTTVDEFTTDQNGCFYFYNELKAGQYRLEEVEASEWYGIGDIYFTVSEDGIKYVSLDDDGAAEGAMVNAAIEKDEAGNSIFVIRAEDKPHTVAVEKVDTEGNRITGAVLGIALSDGNKPMTDQNGNYVLLQLPELVNGSPVFEPDGSFHYVDASWQSDLEFHTCVYVPTGSYYLVELSVPDGYVTAEPIPFTVNNDIEYITVQGDSEKIDHRTLELSMIDRDIDVVISKKVLTTDEELEGASLVLTDGSGNEIDRWVSTKEEHTISSNLLKVDETYTLTETIAPDTYTIANSITFTVEDIAKKQTITMYDDYTRVDFEKVDSNGDAVKGAVLEVFNEDGTLMDSWTTDGTLHEIVALPWGNYVLHEKSAPEGYILADDIAFEVTDRNETVRISMTDHYLYGSLRLTKASSEDHNHRLSGAEFELYQKTEQGDKLLGTYVTDSNGEIYIDKLIYGRYYMKETKANQYYELNEEILEFEITADELLELEYYNSPKVGTLYASIRTMPGKSGSVRSGVPETSDHAPVKGIVLLMIASLMMMLGLLYMNRKRVALDKKKIKAGIKTGTTFLMILLLVFTVNTNNVHAEEWKQQTKKGKTYTEQVTYESDNPEEEYSFDESVTVGKRTYNLVDVSYDVALQGTEVPEDVTRKTKVVTYSNITAEEAENIKKTLTENGIEYYLEEVETEQVLQYEDVTGYISSGLVDAAPSTHEATDIIEYESPITNEITVQELPYVNTEMVSPYQWRDGFSITVSFVVYDSEYYMLGSSRIDIDKENPALSEETKELILTSLNLPLSSYTIESCAWEGEPYDKDGVLYRNLTASGKAYLAEYHFNYEKESAETGNLYNLVVTYLESEEDYETELEEATIESYEITATAQYQRAAFQPTAIHYAILGLILLVIIATVLYFVLLNRRRKNANKETLPDYSEVFERKEGDDPVVARTKNPEEFVENERR